LRSRRTRSQAELADELLANIQWLILEPEIIESEQEWQKALESGADLRLRLTPDESKVINTNGNILLSGNAGTGKTTVGLYRIAKALQANNNAKCLYVAYNPILVQESKEQFKQLSGNDIHSFPGLEFLTIRDLCLQVAKDLGENFDRRLIDYSYFHQHYNKHKKAKKYPPSLVWNEIRSIVKGAKLTDLHNLPLLSQSEYEDLGKKRSEVIQERDRPEIYQLARWYQKHIDSRKLADEVDLAQTTLRIINEHAYNLYTSIVCDEVQDLAEIQLEILIRLLAKNGEILCAGDINQMISPSGFRWGDLTTRLYDNNLTRPKEIKLPFNFRSTGNLVSLAVKILRLKFQILRETQVNEELPVNTSGELARLVQASSKDIEQIRLGAADAVLVRTEERKEKLTEVLGTKLIFTIEESKGLEFDAVYLIDFFEKSSELWTDFLSPSEYINEQRQKQQKPELRLEFNLLYVAITRARRILNICEPKTSDLWSSPEISKSLIQMGVKEAFCESQSTTTQDWYQRAIYYRDARLLPRALECAIKSEDETLKQEIELEIELGYLLIDCKYEDAAYLLLKANKYLKAAEYFEKAELWQAAANAWELAGIPLRKSECQIKHLIKNGEENEAAKILISIGRYTEAAELIEFEKYWDRAADIWRKLGDKKRENQCLLKSSIIKKNPKQKTENFDKEVDSFKPQRPEDYFNRGLTKCQSGENQAAICDFNSALIMDPQFEKAYFAQGLAKCQLGDNQAAIDDFNCALTIDPQYADAYFNRGLAKYQLGDNQAAIDDFNCAFSIDPQFAMAYFSMGLKNLL